MRQKIKKPLSTERAAKMLTDRLDKLASTSAEKIDLLNNAILHNWQSVYPKGDGYGGNNGGQPKNSGGNEPQYGIVL